MRFPRSLFAVGALLCALAGDRTARAVPDASTLLSTQLPFPSQPHPFTLSDALFAANEPVASSHSNNNGDATDASAKPPATTPRATRLADVPFPTGAFWTNLVLEQGESVVTTLPYAFKLLRGEVHVSYPFRVVMPTIIQNGFLPEIVLSSTSVSADPDRDTNAQLTHKVVAFDALSATVRFARNGRSEFSLMLVRGAPFVTVEYTASVPTLSSTGGIVVQRIKKLTDQRLANGERVDFAVFLVALSSGQTWSVYASDPALELTLDAATGRATAAAPFTGTLRVALCLDDNVRSLLLESAAVYPVGGDVDYSIDRATDSAQLVFKWKVRYFGTNGTNYADPKLLMLALPHHIDALARTADNATTVNELAPALRFTSIKGMMTGVFGATWHLHEPLPRVDWDFGTTGLFAPTTSSDGDTELDTKRRTMRKRAEQAIVDALAKDADAYPALAVDSYNFGKQISRDARLLLLADRFDQQVVADKLLLKLKRELAAWLTGTNADALVYDQTFGGLVTRDGMRDEGADYGNGRYNDHHFHYGYMVYALAVVRKFDPEFIATHALACALLIGDIGAPVLSRTSFFADVPVAQLFPVARHKDWFVGHSYASGLFSMEVGKSQESSSESVNAYYALALFSSLDNDALGDESYHQYTRLLLATELRSSKTYWHMEPNSAIYEPVFAANTIVGVAGEMSVVYSTWFGDKAVYVHGINMIPFTPVTPQLLPTDFVTYEYPLLTPDLASLEPHDIWRSVIVLDHAIVDAQAAWDELTTTVTAFDTWNSAANSLYWVATRPTWFTQKALSKQPEQYSDRKCFGFPACSTAGANGTALGCCNTLPGCCPSPLGCCPQPDPRDLPVTACYGEHTCAVLGLGCCNSIDGCCEPDPLTGAVLGCCRDQHPKTLTPLQPTVSPVAHTNSSIGSSSSDTCYNEPVCAAAKLDCCTSPGGCCATVKLDCCKSSSPIASTTTTSLPSSTATDTATCQGQPQCAAAKLECCMAPQGCCVPDPVTGTKLLCCEADATDDPNATQTLPPLRTPADAETCHGDVACLTGGTNGTALDCCFTPQGCCPGLLCCNAYADDDDDVSSDSDDAHTTTKAKRDEASAVNVVFAIVVGVVGLGVIAFCLTMCYRRRHYAPIDHDLRAWYCAAMVLVVVVFFVFLVANA